MWLLENYIHDTHYMSTGKKFLNEEANCHGNSFHTLLLSLLLVAHGMKSLPSEVISLAKSSQLT